MCLWYLAKGSKVHLRIFFNRIPRYIPSRGEKQAIVDAAALGGFTKNLLLVIARKISEVRLPASAAIVVFLVSIFSVSATADSVAIPINRPSATCPHIAAVVQAVYSARSLFLFSSRYFTRKYVDARNRFSAASLASMCPPM